ncbi:MAG: hypothetical protein ACT4QC_18570 [Planctomycetaceae bacterium]
MKLALAPQIKVFVEAAGQRRRKFVKKNRRAEIHIDHHRFLGPSGYTAMCVKPSDRSQTCEVQNWERHCRNQPAKPSVTLASIHVRNLSIRRNCNKAGFWAESPLAQKAHKKSQFLGKAAAGYYILYPISAHRRETTKS